MRLAVGAGRYSDSGTPRHLRFLGCLGFGGRYRPLTGAVPFPFFA